MVMAPHKTLLPVTPPMCGAVIHLTCTLLFIFTAWFVLLGMTEELISVMFAAGIIRPDPLLPR